MEQTGRAQIGGVIVPLLTPFTETGEVDQASLRQLISRCTAAGADAVFVGGSAGMGPMLTDAQWECALETALEHAADQVQVYCGIIATSTQRALHQIAVSRRLGCSTIVVTPTFYIALKSSAEMLAHFQACREATDQEMIIYNIPSCTSSTIPVEVVRTVAERGWSRAMKESSGNRDYFLEVLRTGREFGMAVLQGNEPDICWGLRRGASGIVPVCANCEPTTFVAAVQAARAGEWEEVMRLQERIDLVRDTILIGEHNWIAGLAFTLGEFGIGAGRPLLPLQPVGDARRERIRTFFAPAIAGAQAVGR